MKSYSKIQQRRDPRQTRLQQPVRMLHLLGWYQLLHFLRWYHCLKTNQFKVNYIICWREHNLLTFFKNVFIGANKAGAINGELNCRDIFVIVKIHAEYGVIAVVIITTVGGFDGTIAANILADDLEVIRMKLRICKKKINTTLLTIIEY